MKNLFTGSLATALCFLMFAGGCKDKQEEREGEVKKKEVSKKEVGDKEKGDKKAAQKSEDPSFNRLDRNEFNAAAVRANVGLFWRTQDGQELSPQNLVALLFYPPLDPWKKNEKFTPEFVGLYEKLVKDTRDGSKFPADIDEKEKKRRKLIRKELEQGRPTLVYNNLRTLPQKDKKFVRLMHDVAKIIDELYAQQRGITKLADQIPEDDSASASVFRRNWGPKCYGPETESNPDCSAIPGGWKEVVGVYPAELQKEEKEFCKKIADKKVAEGVSSPFTVVKDKEGKLTGVPYSEAYKEKMGQIAKKLEEAAALFEGSKEQTLVKYLKAAAKAFKDNNWEPADEAWAAMNAKNSSWYLRVGPDEVYWDPCNQKAGFHMTFARINKDSLAWQEKLTKVQQKMEDAMAEVIGSSYKSRKVTFQMPDFIDIVMNAGDDRKPFGAVIGQSLPNWGPVANEGRGRTVTMTNLYTDQDSRTIQRKKALSVVTSTNVKDLPKEGGIDLLGIMLHEATHNFGPSHEYKVKGKKDTELFGGPLATLLEELKAQTGALFYIDFLLNQGVIDDRRARDSYVDAFMWALGHISRGMYTPTKKPKPYSQLAAIHVGFLIEKGAVTFDKNAKAANGKDTGAFTLHLDKFPAAIKELMKISGQIKAKGDKATAEKLIEKYVDSDAVPHDLIKERMLRYPKASFVYSYDI